MSKRSWKNTTEKLADEIAEAAVPENTKLNNEYWKRIFLEYLIQRDITWETFRTFTKEIINVQLKQFFTGLTKKNGNLYKRSTLKNSFDGIARILITESFDHGTVDIHNDSIFHQTRMVVTAKCKEAIEKGLGDTSSCSILSVKDEKILLMSETCNPDTPQGLLNRVFFFVGKFGAVRGGQHHDLCFSYFKREIEDNKPYYIITFRKEKNNQGGINQNNFKGRTAILPPDIDNTINTSVRDLDTYFALRPQGCVDSLYLAINEKGKDKNWFKKSALGINQLRGLFKRMCESANIKNDDAHLTNHSLRATIATRMYQNGAHEQIIQQTTGHKSVCALRGYQKSTKKMRIDAALLGHTRSLSPLRKSSENIEKFSPQGVEIVSEEELTSTSHVITSTGRSNQVDSKKYSQINSQKNTKKYYFNNCTVNFNSY